MPIGDVSILELVIRQLVASGVHDITLSVGYLSHLIRAVLGADDERLEQITYVQEVEPLGTAGPLRLIPRPDETFIVMNGDVLTTIDFRDLLRHHRRCGSAVTIASHQRTIKIDYGVLHLEDSSNGPVIRAFQEKPEIASSVSMGIYVMEPHVVDMIPQGQAFDFPDLVHRLLDDGQQVGAYPFEGMWFDIGRAEDYEQAVTAWLNHEAGAAGAQETTIALEPPEEAQVVAVLR
jgi:NDP-sugar pyrophosphorylase family protein